jgi:hypothetical protein
VPGASNKTTWNYKFEVTKNNTQQKNKTKKLEQLTNTSKHQLTNKHHPHFSIEPNTIKQTTPTTLNTTNQKQTTQTLNPERQTLNPKP